MQPLDKALRNKLESSVKSARDIAEDAAKAALEQLGVGEAISFDHLSEDERKLRRKLRVHGRQLGDIRDSENQKQEIVRLVEEIAYQHWHRMLFARFLAENNLLMYPDPDEPVAVTLEECEDLAADEGANNGWELAARYASKMLPQIFRLDSPVFKLSLSPEHQLKLEQLLSDLPIEMFTASDSLGWVYQYWQAKRKDEVNASGVKIGARELPAVTQLFTEPYMVSFLLDNALGAWWATRRLSDEDRQIVDSEKELRQKASLPGVPLDYLRFVKNEDGKWTPAAGTFENWPKHLSKLKTLDPCCGSGHFLVAAFLMLVPMRMELEDLSAKEAVDAVLRDNLNGLELDQRCVELAAFALAIEAWKYPKAGGYRKLPKMNIACSGLSISAKKEDWLSLTCNNNNLRIALDELYNQFKKADVLGSLIDPEAKLANGTLFEHNWETVGPLLTKALSNENSNERNEIGVVAQGVAKVAALLAMKYELVVTNVPYLSFKKMGDELKEHIKEHFYYAKGDLANVFLERCISLCADNGAVQSVMTQNWLFLKSYKQQRKRLLQNLKWNLLIKLGGGAEAFTNGPGNITNICMITKTKSTPIDLDSFQIIDVSKFKKTEEKSIKLKTQNFITEIQKLQLENPDARIASGINIDCLLEKKAICPRGVVSGDGERWVKRFWENWANEDWHYFQGTVSDSEYYSGRDKIIDWSFKGRGMLRPGTGNLALGKKGVNVSLIGKLPVTIYTGELYDQTTASIIPNNIEELVALYLYCSSTEFYKNVREIDQKLNVTPATLIKISFDLEHWSKVAKVKYPNGLPKPYSNSPSQWVFHGYITKSETPIHVTVARLLGYRWPAELDTEMELSNETREWIKKCDSLLSYADDDGIVCIPSVRGEATASDRIQNLLKVAYGNLWNTDMLPNLLKQVSHAGKNLDSWLRDKFFIQHCKLFHHRPFIWQIWDGLSDGFSALINYHKLDYKLLEILTYNYLGDWISRQKDDLSSGIDGAEEKFAAAENLKKKLELILEGEAPHDIFVRWKPIEKQAVGWNPDLNDGVRLNIRPFMTVGDIRKKGAGILRDKPNIKWNKDRGKDVPSAPWYHLGPAYDGKEGDRINDHHLTLSEKQKARELIPKDLAEEN